MPRFLREIGGQDTELTDRLLAETWTNVGVSFVFALCYSMPVTQPYAYYHYLVELFHASSCPVSKLQGVSTTV